MYSLLNLLGLIKVVGQRQRSYLGLVLALAAGFTVAVALVVSIPLYTDAVGYRILRTELQPDAEGSQRPPFAYMFSWSAENGATASLDGYRRADTYFSRSAAKDLGLPSQVNVRYATTDKLRLLPPQSQAQAGPEMMWVNVGFASGIEQKIEMADGALPRPSSGSGPVEVMVQESTANKLGLQVGEQYQVQEKPGVDNPIRLPVRIAGVWRQRNSNDPYWFVRPESLADVLLLPEQSFNARLLNQSPRALYQAIWYLVLDGTNVRSRHVPALNARIDATLRTADVLLPGTQLRISPQDALQRQYAEVQLLTLSLVVFSVPILALIAYFIIMVAGMVVQRQQNEIAVLRSRGVSRGEVLGIYLLEGVILGIVALVVGIFLAQYVAQLVGWTRSFLRWQPRVDTPVELSPEAIRDGLWVIGLTLLASVLPALGAAGHTIISYKQEQARSVRRPLWQRLYLDFLLLIPAYYGYQQLRQSGTISVLGQGGTAGDPVSNPLLILTPALWLLALGLLCARLFPLLMGLIGSIVSRLPGVSGLLALRYLTRTPRAYTGPVLLLILTLSLATFTASMAKTLDSHLRDQVFYDTGADMRVVDLGQTQGSSGAGGTGGGGGASGGAGATDNSGAGGAAGSGAATSQQSNTQPTYVFLPVTEYLKLPGVTDATRVTRSPADAQVGDNHTNGTLLGIDRLDFSGVAHWRSDYAPQSLGALMNALAVNPNGILVSRQYLRQQGLNIGSKLNLQLHDVETAQSVPFVVVGELNYFPTLYPEDGPFFVANADYLFEAEGGLFPYEVWLNVTPGTTKQQIELAMFRLELRSIVSDEAPKAIVAAEDQPARQGLYGLLSVGFLASALLTGLGFLFYSVISFQRRFIELGMLRAIGLSVPQMGLLLLLEQGLIIGMGILAGTVLGVGVSRYFIPFLQVQGGQHPQTPPFVVLIAWDQIWLIYLIFAVLLGLALAAVATLLLRMKIFQAVKLGEAV